MSAVTPGVPAPASGSDPLAVGELLVPPSSRTALAVRLLLAVGLLVSLLQSLTEPVERPLGDLLHGLQEGEVRTVTMARPEPGAEAHGTWEVRWTGGGLPGRASYEVAAEDGFHVVDEGQLILDAAKHSPTPVDVTVRYNFLDPGTTWHVGAFVGLAALLWLIGGPQPRLATKWAWFWIACNAPLLWLAFVVLEPVPLWNNRPLPQPPRRLTGGWAFLLSVTAVPFVGGVLMSAIDWLF
ncbi:hypothetical protein ATJ97_3518 [Georgenia soli]|uniref:Uncharacterized protein n=1 Tax=Georgenia soli TaxID=638953 RepID=A0A2A9EQC5_9MICO|nr:hypothetical protein [Georgenia soli]PFG40973.1 hypothetical protein ATJ97_3518 [Georgenia soli]